MIFNNIAYGWSNVSIKIGPSPFSIEGITEISGMGADIDIGELRGAGNRPLEMTEGIVTFSDLSLTLNKSAWESMIGILGSLQPQYGDGLKQINDGTHARFDLDVLLEPKVIIGAPVPQLIRRTFKTCRIKTYDEAFAQGADTLQSSITVKYLDITRGGVASII